MLSVFETLTSGSCHLFTKARQCVQLETNLDLLSGTEPYDTAVGGLPRRRVTCPGNLTVCLQ